MLITVWAKMVKVSVSFTCQTVYETICNVILLKAYFEAKREAARVAKQSRQMEVL